MPGDTPPLHPAQLDTLMASLLPPQAIDRRAVLHALMTALGPLHGIRDALALHRLEKDLPVLIPLGARIGVELLLRHVAPWLTPILLDSPHSAAEVRAGSEDHVPDVMELIDVLVEVERPENLHAVTRAIMEGEGQ